MPSDLLKCYDSSISEDPVAFLCSEEFAAVTFHLTYRRIYKIMRGRQHIRRKTNQWLRYGKTALT